MPMRSEQDRRTGMGWRQQQSSQSGDERSAGQYEKDSWRPDWRRDAPRREQESRGRRFAGAGYGRRAERRSDDVAPYEASQGYDPFEPGQSRETDWRRGERRYPPGPKGYQRSDERLREDISERLMAARYIDSSDVTVAVCGAKVLLEGTVPERRMKHAIEDLADACPGVQDIENKIRVQR